MLGTRITPTMISLDDMFQNRSRHDNQIKVGDIVENDENGKYQTQLVMGTNLDHPFPETHKGKYALMCPIKTSSLKWIPQKELNGGNYDLESQLDIRA